VIQGEPSGDCFDADNFIHGLFPSPFGVALFGR
jgi:hypothetical protein